MQKRLKKEINAISTFSITTVNQQTQTVKRRSIRVVGPSCSLDKEIPITSERTEIEDNLDQSKKQANQIDDPVPHEQLNRLHLQHADVDALPGRI